jgi:hypothetical protein
MRKPIVQQMLLTRFNIRTSGVGWTPDQAPGWLEGRFDLFARYCVPSVAAQTVDDFEWIIFCDVNTSDEILARIQKFDPRIRLVLVMPEGAVTSTSHVASSTLPVVSHVSPVPLVRLESGMVISTRLDSDDAISVHALARARSYADEFLASGHRTLLYNPLRGFQWDQKSRRLYIVSKPNSAFLTMFERVEEGVPPQGPYAGNHSFMHQAFPSYQDDGPPLWMMILHGGNVRNRLGRTSEPVPLDVLEGDFPVDLTGSPG